MDKPPFYKAPRRTLTPRQRVENRMARKGNVLPGAYVDLDRDDWIAICEAVPPDPIVLDMLDGALAAKGPKVCVEMAKIKYILDRA